ncbi:M48 family metalloprotease [Simiduia sp. 21SJ11W-1]|uniref:M48 family metalloprotease n=1 Tax=Simiduia sp. 21SJ11W-1 TaxID=2909669 RepID=UPI0020A1F2A2|nr:M48 family metalloprotease [Simiduia sp. 21SJ11W-1]UTA46656.1 M48 family metalloprotease [Simiduia sp. 21SJ11W-1]
MNLLKAFALSAIAITCALLGACAVNPATGTPDFVFMSEESEIKKGKELHEKIIASTPVYQDEKLTEYVNNIGQKLVKVSDRPDIPYTFTIIDSPDINAFALPGGYIYINRGLIGYLSNEAQLAAVIAHEIAHVTARHTVRQDAARKGASAVSVATVITTGSMVAADAADLWTSAAVSGYGRDMELEADSFGAKYLYRAKYDPNAMIDVIGVLKDQERYARYRAKEAGQKPKSYHGVFSTHPRNDQRLQEVIATAGTLPKDADGQLNTKEFRMATNGMVVGINYDMAMPGQENRYIHRKLGFTFVHPAGWKVENQRSKLVAVPEDKHTQLELGIAMLRVPMEPSAYLRDELNIGLLQQSEPLKQFGLIGHTGLAPAEAGKPGRRVAVLFQGNRAYQFSGTVTNEQDDADFMGMINTFQPAQVPPKGTSKRIRYVIANENTRYEALANHGRLGPNGADQLRLLNGDYPRGEPTPGEWIKIVE